MGQCKRLGAIDENKALVQRYYDAVVNKHDLTAIFDFLAPSFVSHGPSGPGVDVEAHRNALENSHVALPDLQLTVEDQVAEADKVVTRWRARGTHSGVFLGILPSQEVVTATAIHIHRIADGRIVEQWEQFDTLGLLQQIGALPAIT